MHLRAVVVAAVALALGTGAFNVDLHHAVVVVSPTGADDLLFGYSVALTPAQLLVGEPRGEWPSRPDILEPGALHRCRLDMLGLSQPQCSDIRLDMTGNDMTYIGGHSVHHLKNTSMFASTIVTTSAGLALVLDDKAAVLLPTGVRARLEEPAVPREALPDERAVLQPGLEQPVPPAEAIRAPGGEREAGRGGAGRGLSGKDQERLLLRLRGGGLLRARQPGADRDGTGPDGWVKGYDYDYPISDCLQDAGEVLLGAPGVYSWRGSVVRYRINEAGQLVEKFVTRPDSFEDYGYFGLYITVYGK
ncbi:hypothetical protein FOCC_FOCC002717 [Frankliniella occidentalis]|nr:hypothetical protein FOCC_FOCC002717 [Frankliniella occidentalis]